MSATPRSGWQHTLWAEAFSRGPQRLVLGQSLFNSASPSTVLPSSLHHGDLKRIPRYYSFANFGSPCILVVIDVFYTPTPLNSAVT